ncbi:MAG: hypothetical protein LBB49_00885, partial [Gracilibacteraceae bacterium]|jgi:hypothetical protein|nr:hypothetical protein [Gracilibacteraceae bacterium]
MAQYLDADIINPYDILKNICGEPENLTKLQAMAKSWEIFHDDPGFGGLMRSIGGSLTTFFDATDYGKSNIPDPAHILDGIIKGCTNMGIFAGDVLDYAASAFYVGMSHIPGINKLMPEHIKEFTNRKFAEGNAAIGDFIGMGTPLDWLELVGFIMNTPVYVVVSGVTALVTQGPMRFPIILEKLGDGIKEEITHIYEERGYVNGSLYVVGELLPLLLGTKGLGATTKAAEETAQAAKILKEAKTAFAAATLKETEAAVKAAEAVEAARLLEMKNLLEDMTVWKNQPVLVTSEGVPIGRQFTFAEIRAQQMEARALEKAALESEGYGIMGVEELASSSKLVKDPHTGVNSIKADAKVDPKRVDDLGFDHARGKQVPHEGEAAAQLENATGGKLETVQLPASPNQPPLPDYKFVDGPHAGKTVDLMWTADANNPKALQGLNDNFGKHLDPQTGKIREVETIKEHLEKADIVTLDYRRLTPANQSLADSWINGLTLEQQSRIVILR